MDIPQGKGGNLIGFIKCIAWEVMPTKEEFQMCCELSKCMHSADVSLVSIPYCKGVAIVFSLNSTHPSK
jgi:hypothetical protein